MWKVVRNFIKIKPKLKTISYYTFATNSSNITTIKTTSAYATNKHDAIDELD